MSQYYQIKGVFRVGKEWRKFTKTISAHNEKFAIEKAYSILGSNHKVKRNLIKIEDISKIENAEELKS